MTETWFAFKAYNTETLYGFGTGDEASKYEDHLNKDREINHYGAVQVEYPSGAEFNIGDELQAIKNG